MSQALSASPPSAYAPSRVAANACPGPARASACTGGRSTRHPFTTGPTGHAGRPRLSSHALRVGSSRYSPRSVPTQTRPPVSGASARTRLPHSAPGGGQRTGVAYSVHVRPPSVERASPRRWPAHTLPSAPRASASTYRLRSRPHGWDAASAPLESLISAQVTPRSHDSLIPSAVPTYTVSPSVTMPLGATYCHSGPSCLSSQLVQVLPPSVERPHPFPTVPYQLSPFGPNPKACTKSKEIVRPVVSLERRSCSQLPAPCRRTKIPCPYVPTQTALSGARARASTCTPKPVVSGSGGSVCPAVGSGAPSTISAPKSAECGMRSAEWSCLVRRARSRSTPALLFRIPHSALRICLSLSPYRPSA